MRAFATLPEVTLEVGGTRLDGAEVRSLSDVRVQQRLNLPAQCELVFRNPPAAFIDDSRLTIGAALRVSVRGQPIPLFDGEVTALELVYAPDAGQVLHVRAYDRLHRLRKHAPIRAHVDLTLVEIARELLGAAGVAVQANADGPRSRYLIQHRQNDFDFLRERAEQAGLYFSLRQSTLHLFTLEGLDDGPPLTLGQNLLEARFERNADTATADVSAHGWDSETVAAFAGASGNARSGRSVEASIAPADVGADGTRHLVDLRLSNTEQADTVAQADFDRRAAHSVVFSGVTDGNTALQPGARVEVLGVASAYAGRYVLTSVTHRIDTALGYVTEIETTPTAPLPRTRGTLATLGVVTQIDDPEALGRVRVALPTFDDVTTHWVHVVSAGAGGGKGLMMLPDVGDEVLVLVSDEDLAQAVVVGGLYGGRGLPDTGIDGGAVRRYTVLTPGGQRVTLDDVRGAIRLENRDGSFVDMTPEKLRIHASVDLEIEAPGKAIVVRGNTIDFQRG